MPLELFAVIHVSDYEGAKVWYSTLLGFDVTFEASPTEGVWELAEHRYVVVEQDDTHPERVGHAAHTVFVDHFDERVAAIAARGISPSKQEVYDNGVRKTHYQDADGNELSFGGAPQ